MRALPAPLDTAPQPFRPTVWVLPACWLSFPGLPAPGRPPYRPPPSTSLPDCAPLRGPPSGHRVPAAAPVCTNIFRSAAIAVHSIQMRCEDNPTPHTLDGRARNL